MTSRTLTPVRVQGRLRREEGGLLREQESGHVSVMLDEVLQGLEVQDGEVVVDATYGLGGHSAALKAEANIHLIAIDADPKAGVIEANFGDLDTVLKKEKITQVDKVLFDLGWNSTQLVSGRGFSFLHDEVLNMSYGKKPASGFTASEIVNTWDEETLANVFYGYGEEKYSRRIAKAIVERRALQPIKTTIELEEIVRDAVPAAYRKGRLHPATRTFQALRMATNDELGVTERGLASAWAHLACGGRIAVITFHSIEDRLVKRLFAAYAKEGGKLVYKKPVAPSRAEIIRNPRARSAKLRVIEKICQK